MLQKSCPHFSFECCLLSSMDRRSSISHFLSFFFLFFGVVSFLIIICRFFLLVMHGQVLSQCGRLLVHLFSSSDSQFNCLKQGSMPALWTWRQQKSLVPSSCSPRCLFDTTFWGSSLQILLVQMFDFFNILLV